MHAAIPRSVPLLRLAILSATTAALAAQCDPAWQAGDGVPGLFANGGAAHAMTAWDPDGAGPRGPVLVIGGYFSAAGNVLAENLASWDPASDAWSALGTGTNPGPLTNSVVSAVAAHPSGDLIVAGNFHEVGGVPANHIARWDGTQWSALALGTNNPIAAVTTLPNGDIVVGGNFTWATSVTCRGIARWDGAAWSPLGSGMSPAIVNGLTTLPNGDVIAVGPFQTAGGVPCGGVARWDGTSWSALGSGIDNLPWAVASLPNGDVVVGGLFTTAGGVPAKNIARWDGTQWSALGAGRPAAVLSLTVLPNGDLVAGGEAVMVAAQPTKSVGIWDGSIWTERPVGAWNSSGMVRTVQALPSGELFAGGAFTAAQGIATKCVARWTSAGWGPLHGGLDGPVHALAAMPNGDLVAGGVFTTVGKSVQARNVARFDGSGWRALGPGLSGEQALGPGSTAVLASVDVFALHPLANGDLVAGGVFTAAGSTWVGNLARWDGAVWSPIGGGVNGPVRALASLPNGDLVAGGAFTVAGGVPAVGLARWNGISWSPFGTGINGGVSALQVLPNGDLLVGGGFTMAGGMPANCIARWDGMSWSPLGAGIGGGAPTILVPSVLSLAVLRNGDVVAGGWFGTAGGAPANSIARWDGSTWWPMDGGVFGYQGQVWALEVLPNGDLLAGGKFSQAGVKPANCIARWTSGNWQAVDGSVNEAVIALRTLPNGDVVAGGLFSSGGGQLGAYLSRLRSPCLAETASFGSGCIGPGGGDALTAASRPWLGSSYRAIGTGLPTSCEVLSIFGAAALVPPLSIDTVFPQAGPGCRLFVVPDLVASQSTDNGSVEVVIPVPNLPALIGVTLHHQLVAVVVDSGLQILEIGSSNALRLTLGAF